MNAPMRARRRTQLKTVSLAASKHLLASGPLRGMRVGSLTAEVLEDQKDVLSALKREAVEGSFTAQHLDADWKAVEAELQRRWLAVTT